MAAAVGGAAIFARESGKGLTEAVHLAAPPEQHLAAPGAVFIAPSAPPAGSRRIVQPAGHAVFTTLPGAASLGTPLRPVRILPARPQPLPRPTVPRTQPQRPAPPRSQPQPQPQAPNPAPATPTPGPTPLPAPAQPAPAQPEPPRVVASAVPVPVPEPVPVTPPPPPLPPAPIRSTPLTAVVVSSENVHGIAPGPGIPVTPPQPVENGGASASDQPGELQSVHIKDVAPHSGN